MGLELLQRISDNLYTTLNSRETKAMLTRMPHPNKKLEKLAQATVMFLEAGSTSDSVDVPDWKHCQKYLINHGFKDLNFARNIPEEVFSKVSLLVDGISEAAAISAAGNLGLSLSKFIDQMYKFSDQERDVQDIEGKLAETRQRHKRVFGELDFKLKQIRD